jgi:hypothetical protein
MENGGQHTLDSRPVGQSQLRPARWPFVTSPRNFCCPRSSGNTFSLRQPANRARSQRCRPEFDRTRMRVDVRHIEEVDAKSMARSIISRIITIRTSQHTQTRLRLMRNISSSNMSRQHGSTPPQRGDESRAWSTTFETQGDEIPLNGSSQSKKGTPRPRHGVSRQWHGLSHRSCTHRSQW